MLKSNIPCSNQYTMQYLSIDFLDVTDGVILGPHVD